MIEKIKPSEDIALERIDLSQEFLTAIRPTSFEKTTQKYRHQAVHLTISIPWNGDKFRAIKLKAFLENKPDIEIGQKRTAQLTGNESEYTEAIAIPDVKNALSSGVKWKIIN